MYEYNPAWPPELQEAERRRYRAACKVRCLTSSLDRIRPEEFEQVMNQIEEAQAEAYTQGHLVLAMKWEWECAAGFAYPTIKKTAQGAANTPDGMSEPESANTNQFHPYFRG